MNSFAQKFAALFTLALLGSTAASAQLLVVNVNFNERANSVYVGQGAFADVGNDFWNDVQSTTGASNLIASNGTTATGVSVSISGVNGLGTGTTPSFAPLLFDQYLHFGGNPASFTISGLTPGTPYELYLYGQSGTGGATDRMVDFTINGVTQTITGANVGSFISGVNFVMFALTPGSSSVSGSFVQNPGTGEGNFSGLQIAAIPEPSTFALLAVALGFVATSALWRRRAKSPTA